MEGEMDPKILGRLMQYQQQQDNLVKFQLDSSPELFDLYLDLLGKAEDEEGNIIDDPNKFKMINGKGANLIMSGLKPRSGKLFSLSDMDDKEIRKRCLCYVDNLTWVLHRHLHEFEIPSFQVADYIIEICDDIFFSTMKKADQGGERDSLRKTFQHVESSEKITQSLPKQKAQFFSNPLTGGR